MEYVFGKDLRAVLARTSERRAALPVALAARIGMEAARGLGAAHRLMMPDGAPTPVVHRDVSPHNILLSFSGEVKITDFGIARLRSGSTLTRSGVLKGKFGYMSPEQAAGRDTGVRSDVFSLGIVMWEMLVRRRLFTGRDEMEVLERVKKADVRPPSAAAGGIPPALEAIVMKALEGRSEARFGDCAEMAGDLEKFLRGWPHDPADESVADFLAALYPGERRHAARTVTEVAGPEAAGETTGKGEISPSRARTLKAGEKSRAPLVAVLILIAAVCAGAAGWWILGRGGRIPPPAEHSAAPAPAPSAEIDAAAPTAAEGVPDAGPAQASCGASGDLCKPAEPPDRPAAAESGPAPEMPAVLPEPQVQPNGKPAREVRSRPGKKGGPMEARKSSKVMFDPVTMGFLSVNANPWAEVSVRDYVLGTTPLTRVGVPPGEHVIILKNPELGTTREVTVRISTGREERISVDMR
jgi:hypothetical protein